MSNREVMQQALEALQYGKSHKAISILLKALEQPEQEPVAWMSSDRAWMWSDYNKALAAVVHIPRLTLIPLYAAPPLRPWVGLTDEDWEWVADKKETSLDTFAHGAAWAADQLKERNT